jgi:hypothetical protein
MSVRAATIYIHVRELFLTHSCQRLARKTTRLSIKRKASKQLSEATSTIVDAHSKRHDNQVISSSSMSRPQTRTINEKM